MSICLGCFKQVNEKVYCNACSGRIFNGKSPILNINKSEFKTIRYKLIDHFSISGVQDKISLKLSGRELHPVVNDGEFILKPVPSTDIEQLRADIPANEHLTMQIAKQLFGIQTAENALIRFSDGELAYITKRFDRKGKDKVRVEDFCQISEISPESNGPDFKYGSSYQSIGNTVYKHCAAARIEIEKLFKLVVFNYIFGNGDAHLKNFSLIETVYGDFVLSPAYDLINTNIHLPNESRTALDLFDDYESEHFKNNGFYGREDFMKLSEFYNINSIRAQKIITVFSNRTEQAKEMISSSFLSVRGKEKYLAVVYDRLKAIKE
jgi:serine/threonine-protein kinase HipA